MHSPEGDDISYAKIVGYLRKPIHKYDIFVKHGRIWIESRLRHVFATQLVSREIVKDVKADLCAAIFLTCIDLDIPRHTSQSNS